MGGMGMQYDRFHDGKREMDKQIELANTYFFKGRKSLTKGYHDETLKMFRASIAIQEEVYGTYHKRTVRSYFFLAQTLFKHTKEFDRALTAYRRTLRIGLSLGGDLKYIEGAKRALRELLRDKKSFVEKNIENFFTSITESVSLEKEGIDHTSKKNYRVALEAFEKCLAIEEKAEGTFPLDLGHLYIRIAEVNKNEGDHEMAINAYRSALSIYEDALGIEYADSIFCLQGIKSCLHEMNFSDSVIQEYSKSIFRSLHHCKTGDALIESNMFQRAIDEYEAARLIEEKNLGKYPLTVSGIRKKIGLAFQSLNEYDRALMELRTALSINIFECGDDHQSVAATMQVIRSVMGEKGYEFSAINKYMNTVAFSIKHERYGEHLLLEKGDFSAAIEEFQKSLALEVSALGKYHLTQGGLFKAIGDAFLQDEIFDFAIVNYRNALIIYQPILGTQHDSTISVLTSIGNAVRGTGLDSAEIQDYRVIVSESIAIEKVAENFIKDGAESNAIAAYRGAVRKEGTLLGDYHLSIADLHGKIAKLLEAIGKYDSALASHRCILAINLKSLGADHLNTEKAHEELVKVTFLKGLKNDDGISYGRNVKISIEHEDKGDEAMINQKFQSAILHYEKALEIEEYFLGKNHLVTEGLLRKIIKCHKLSGKTDQAFQFYRKMIRIYMTYESPDYDTNCMLQSLETTIQDLGLSEAQQVEYINIVKESVKCEIDGDSADESKNYEQAIDQYSRCLLIEQSLLGTLHPSIWSVYKKMGSTFGKQGDIEMAIISHSKALAILESYLGMKEKETMETYNDLLSATLKKISCISDTHQVYSSRDEKLKISPERSDKKLNTKEEQLKNPVLKGDKNEFDDIYNIFTSLKNGISAKVNNREGEKMEILKGLAQKWYDLDECETVIDINSQELIKKNKSTLCVGQLGRASQEEHFDKGMANIIPDKQDQKVLFLQDKSYDSDMASPFTTPLDTKMRGSKKSTDFSEHNKSSLKALIDSVTIPESSVIEPGIIYKGHVNSSNGRPRIKNNTESMEPFENIGAMEAVEADAAKEKDRVTSIAIKFKGSKSDHMVGGSRSIGRSKSDNRAGMNRSIRRSKSDHGVGNRRKIGKLIAQFNNNSAHETIQNDSEEALQLKCSPGENTKSIAIIQNQRTNDDDTSVNQTANTSVKNDFKLNFPETRASERITMSEIDAKNIFQNVSSRSKSSTSLSSCTSCESL